MIYTVKSQHYHLKHITITRLASAIKSIGPEGRTDPRRSIVEDSGHHVLHYKEGSTGRELQAAHQKHQTEFLVQDKANLSSAWEDTCD